MKKKELLALILFLVSIVSWMLVTLITPVGGWNPSSSTYNAVYKELFLITGWSTLGSLFLLIKIGK